MFANNNANMPIGDIPDLVSQAINKTFTAQNALTSFRKAGLFPFNPDMVKVPDLQCQNQAQDLQCQNQATNGVEDFFTTYFKKSFTPIWIY